MAAASNLFEPLAARQLIAAGLSNILKTDADVRKPFAPVVLDRTFGGANIVTIASGDTAIVIHAPFGKLGALRDLLGDALLIQKLISDAKVDFALGQAVARLSYIPAASKKQGRIEVTAWHASGRSVATLRKVRGVSIPPELSITYDKSILEAA